MGEISPEIELTRIQYVTNMNKGSNTPLSLTS